MESRSARAQVKSGFRQAGLWLLGGAWLFLVFAGLGIAFSPGPYSPILGWVFLVIAGAVLVVTMDRWVKVFPALLILATINSTACIFTGHLTGNPSAPISPTQALIAALLLAGSTILSLRLKSHKLRLLDRLSAFVFVFCVFWQAVDERVALVAPVIAFVALLLAWACDRIERHHGPKRRSASVSSADLRF
ncbi:MAG: hypothetical protein ACRD18_05780 [Terriglobia bacterium]